MCDKCKELDAKILQAQKVFEWINIEKNKVVEDRRCLVKERNEVKDMVRRLRYKHIRGRKY